MQLQVMPLFNYSIITSLNLHALGSFISNSVVMSFVVLRFDAETPEEVIDNTSQAFKGHCENTYDGSRFIALHQTMLTTIHSHVTLVL